MLELIAKIDGCDEKIAETLTLPYELRQKSRQRVRLDSGLDAAVLLPAGVRLVDGDVLRASNGAMVLVKAASEELSTARTSDHLLLARACYHLGNRHVSLEVAVDRLRYQPDHVLDEMVRGLGLAVARESACFHPEQGAYHGHAHTSQPHDHPSGDTDAASGGHHDH
jgi:urease accessory protein